MTVFANGKPAVFQQSQGKVTTTDVCLTPPFAIPVPFSNLAQAMDLDKCAQSVFINGYPVAHEKSIFKKSSGDEGGAMLGVTSATVGSTAQFLKGSPDVMVEGFGVVRHGDLVVSNNNNTPSAPFVQPGMEMPAQLKAQYEAQKKIKPTPYVYDVDVVGTRVNSLEQLCAFTKDVASTTMIGGTGDAENTNKVTRRILLRNVAASQNALALRVPVQTGSGMIDLPLSMSTVTPRDSEQDKTAPVAGQAKTIMVACSLAWNTFPYSQTLNVSAGDFTDIARFSDGTRSKIYTDLSTATPDDLQNKPWNKIITAATSAVNTELTSPPAALNAGWLYIFKDGFLWRELQVNAADTVGQNTYEEVNLLQYAGSNQRIASGQATPQLVLPYKVDGTVPKLEIAYSPVQWSWARINYFGGMDPADARLIARKNKTKVPMPSDSSSRSARFATLDLSPFTTSDAQCKQTVSGASDAPTIILINKNMTPTIMINDPVGLVTRIQFDIAQQIGVLRNLVLNAQKEPYFKSALLTYKTFFDDKVAFNKSSLSDAQAQQIASQNARYQTYPMPNQEQAVAQPNSFKQTQGYLNRDKIETILRVNERASIRAIITQLQNALIQLVADQKAAPESYQSKFKADKDTALTFPTLQTKPSWYNTPLSFSVVMTDYFAAPVPIYPEAFAAIGGVLSLTIHSPHIQDAELDVNVEDIHNVVPAGVMYATSIFDEQHPLYDKLFPSKDEAVPTTPTPHTQDDWQNISYKDEDGSGVFRPESFQSAYELTARGAEIINMVLEGFVSAELSKIDNDLKEEFSTLNEMIRLAQFTGNTYFQNITVEKLGTISQDSHIFGIDKEAFSRLSQTTHFGDIKSTPTTSGMTSTERQTMQDSYRTHTSLPVDVANKADNMAVEIDVMKDKDLITKQYITQSNLWRGFSGVPVNQTNFDEFENKMKTGKFDSNIASEVVVEKQIVSDERLEKAVVGLAKLIALFQVYNLYVAGKHYNDNKENQAKKIVNLFSVAFLTLYAFEQIPRATLEGKKAVLAFYEKNNTLKNFMYDMSKAIRLKLTPIAGLGFLANVYLAYDSAKLAMNAWQAHDMNAALGQVMASIGSAGMAVNTLVSYAVKKEQKPEGMGSGTATDAATEEGTELVGGEIMGEAGLEAFWAALGPVGWITGIVALIGVCLIEFYSNTPLESWAKNSPFSNDDPSAMSDAQARSQLLSLLITPQVMISQIAQSADFRTIAIDINLPQFTLGSDTLIVETISTPQILHTNINTHGSYVWKESVAALRLRPSQIKQVMSEDGNTVVKIQYVYSSLPVRINNQPTETTYQAKVRIQGSDYAIPIPLWRDQDDAERRETMPTTTDDEKFWVISEQVI